MVYPGLSGDIQWFNRKRFSGLIGRDSVVYPEEIQWFIRKRFSGLSGRDSVVYP